MYIGTCDPLAILLHLGCIGFSPIALQDYQVLEIQSYLLWCFITFGHYNIILNKPCMQICMYMMCVLGSCCTYCVRICGSFLLLSTVHCRIKSAVRKKPEGVSFQVPTFQAYDMSSVLHCTYFLLYALLHAHIRMYAVSSASIQYTNSDGCLRSYSIIHHIFWK